MSAATTTAAGAAPCRRRRCPPAATAAAAPAANLPTPTALFGTLDEDSTGFVDAPALARFYQLLLGRGGQPPGAGPSAGHIVVAEAALARGDEDGDGKLNLAEFAALMDTPELASKLTLTLF